MIKDESLLALLLVVCPPDGADVCSAARERAANPTRDESCLQLSHRSRAHLLCPSWRQYWKKTDPPSAPKIDAVSLWRQSDAAYLAIQQGA